MNSLRAFLAGIGGLGLTAGVLVAPAIASAAAGSTIVADAGAHSIHFVAGAGQDNYLRGFLLPITREDGTSVHHYRFVDRYPITAGRGCTYPSATRQTVDCALPDIGDFYPQFGVELGDGSDHIVFDKNVGQDSSLDLGPGDDNVIVGVTFAFVQGGSGNDTIRGGGGIDGGDGNDRITADTNTSDISGGRGNDTIAGNGRSNRLFGNSGNDTVRGGKGADSISGGPGDDVLYGNSGDDVIRGGPGRDTISGGPGNDRIVA